MVGKARHAIRNLCGTDSNCCRYKCWRKLTGIACGIARSNDHCNACCDSVVCCNLVRVACATATQAHTHERRTFAISDHPIHRLSDPRCVPARVQHLHGMNCRLLRHTIRGASDGSSAMCAMTMRVRRTSNVTKLASLKCADAFESWNRTASKVLMGRTNSRIQNVHMDTCTLVAWARIGAV
jgi:hypothetical protein